MMNEKENEKEKYLVCFFGVIGRSIRHTKDAHMRCILDILRQNNIPYDVLVVNNNIGANSIDGQLISNTSHEQIPHDFHIELNQSEIDKDIYQRYPNFDSMFIKTPHYEYSRIMSLNAMRQSYIETTVATFLTTNPVYKRVLAVSADFNLIHHIPLHLIENLSTNEVIVSNMNNAGGYTNGLYFGDLQGVKNLMNHYYRLSDIYRYRREDYEFIIKQNAIHYDTTVHSIGILFGKIRADRTVFSTNKRLAEMIQQSIA